MFYANIWDPLLILSQIGLLQCLFYLGVGLWLLFFSLTFGSALTLHAILAPNAIKLFQANGWPPIGAFILVAPMIGYALLLIVGRAKQCLDFTGTLYLFHFLLCSLYHGIPTNWEWWVVNSIGCIVTVILGEYLCLQKELEAIPMTSDERESRERRSAAQRELNAAASSASARHGTDDDTSHERVNLINEEKELRGERGVLTTTIRLAPNNVFNV